MSVHFERLRLIAAFVAAIAISPGLLHAQTRVVLLLKDNFGTTNASALVRTDPPALPTIALRVSEATPQLLADAVAAFRALSSDSTHRTGTGRHTVQVFNGEAQAKAPHREELLSWARSTLQAALAKPEANIPKIGRGRQSAITIPARAAK